MNYPLPDAPSPTRFVVTDLNGDARPGVAFTSGLAKVYVMLTSADESLGQPSATVTSAPGIQLVAGDVNRDGRSDLVMSAGGGVVDVLHNDGTGTFPAVVAYPTGSEALTTSVGLADMNRDKRLDIVAADNAENLPIMLGAGDVGCVPVSG